MKGHSIDVVVKRPDGRSIYVNTCALSVKKPKQLKVINVLCKRAARPNSESQGVCS